MLHGFTQSGRQFQAKTQALREEFHRSIPSSSTIYRGVEFVFPTAPFALSRDALPPFSMDGATKQDKHIDAYTWWHIAGQKPDLHYDGLDTAMSHIADTIVKHGPFDGAIGFSQGAAATAMLASLLQKGRKDAFNSAQVKSGIAYPSTFIRGHAAIQAPLKFAVAFSGFGGTQLPQYRAFYQPKITTPMLHVLGKADDFIKGPMTQELIDSCADSQVCYHGGGHAVPQEPQCIEQVVDFVRTIVR
jgi:predicted esterase